MNLLFLKASEDLIWPMGVPDQSPRFEVMTGNYTRSIAVDPFPAYAHDAKLVSEEAAACYERFPLVGAHSLNIITIDRETTDRINGMTWEEHVWKREDGSEWKEQIVCHCCNDLIETRGQSHTIVLGGKRTPIHPAITRYLIAHEYGHAVFHHTRRAMGYRDLEEDKLADAYMTMRSGPGEAALKSRKYSGGHWHETPGEIIANDFRIHVMGRETEFWPHPVSSPLDPATRDRIAAWWETALRLCSGELKREPVMASDSAQVTA